MAREYQTGQYSYSFVSADINGDGITDVVTFNLEAGTVSVAYGDGAGGFAPPRFSAIGFNVRILAVGDLNNDGKPDLVAPHENQSKFIVSLNNGQGGFSAPTVLTFPNTVSEFYDLKFGDFNGDGNADIAAMSRLNLYIFFGNGQGGLTLNTTLAWDGNNSRIAVGNFNNDNFTDLAIFTGESNYPWELVIILGTANGNFTYNNRYSLTNRPNDIALGDFNGDNLTDIVISANYPFQNSTPQTYYLQPWLGNGSGAFTEGAKINFPYMVNGVTAGDFNGDGKLDLATSMTQLTATIYGIGDGTFHNMTYWTTPAFGRLSAVDVNRDGKKDLISVRGGYPNSFISVVLSAGSDGFFAPKPTLYGGTHIAAGDFNGDQLLDMLTGYYTNFASPSQITLALNGGSSWLADRDYDTALAFDALAIGDFNGDGKKDAISGHDYNGKLYSVYLGDGNGNLSAPLSQQWNRGIRDIVTGDFNNDGKDDFIFLDEQRGYSRLSNGDGTFSAVPNFSFEPTSVFITPQKGDFNRDGKLDFIISDGATAYIWLGAGDGTFTVSDSEPFNTARIAVGDVNGDGNLDLLGFSSAGGTETTLRGILGNADGTFGTSFSKTIPGAASAIVSADFNGDNLADVALAPATVSFNGGVTLFIIPSTGQTPFWGTPVVYSVADIAGPPYGSYQDRIVAADFNADGKIDIGYAGSRSRGVIYNTSNQNPCVSINDVTVTEGDSGISNAVFTVSLSAASSQTVRVNYTLAAQTAVIGEDLQSVSGRLEIPAGQTAVTINVPINGDLVDEFDETFTVNLTSPTNAALGKSTGTGTILDNDAEPSMTIADVSQVEPAFSQGTIFRVSLSAPSAKPISFRCATADGTATAGKDYLASNSTVNFQAGATSADCYVSLLSDNIYELDETFFVNLSEVTNANLTDAQGVGRILNDDPVPSLNIFSNNITEGDYGVTSGTVNIQLSNPSYLPITFNVLTSSGTATADSDYVASDTVITVPAERQTVTANVQIIGDTVNEPNETFFVNLYNVSNATLSTTQAQYLILDDENIPNDFDRDGKTDFAVFRPSDGIWYTSFSSNGNFSATRYGLGSDVPVSGDYNGDGRTDIGVWRASNGTWYTPIANRTLQWGAEGDIPVQGDYDNDGRIDTAVFRPSTGYWYIRQTSNSAFRYELFGTANDIPIPADYDGDGKTDIAVFRPSSGIWYIVRSSDNVNYAIQFGQAGDKLVPADYDGDGKADIAVFRNGVWYLLKSSAGNAFSYFQWGQAGDKPVPGNYDGDDKTDFAVYRNGVWYVYQSSTQTVLSKQFGASDDIPVPFISNN